MGAAHSKLDVNISLDSLTHISPSGGEATSEPYIWAVYFKIDGDTVFYDATSSQLHSMHTIDDPPENGNDGPTGGGPIEHHPPHGIHTHQEIGKPLASLDIRIASGNDSAGDLGFSSIKRQEVKQIAPSMGKYHTILTLIPGNGITSDGVQQIGGWVGMILVLMEADATPAGVRFLAGTEFSVSVADILSDALTSESWSNLSWTTGDFKTKLDAMTGQILAHVRDRIVSESTIDPDDLLGVSNKHWSHLELEAKQNLELVLIDFGNGFDWSIDGLIKVAPVP